LRHVVEVVLEQVVSDSTKLRPANGIVRSAVAFLDHLVDKLGPTGYCPTRRGPQKAGKKLEYEPEGAVFLGTRGPERREVRFATGYSCATVCLWWTTSESSSSRAREHVRRTDESLVIVTNN
jgi:hypothetical protein